MPNKQSHMSKPRPGLRSTPDESVPRNEPYTPESGTRDSALPLGFQSTNDPAFATTHTPELPVPGHPTDDEMVAWDRDDPLVRHADAESDRLGAGFDPTQLGDETGDASSPAPDENLTDEIGREVGVSYADGEEMRTMDKREGRDRERWELNPASAEDFGERTTRENRDAAGEDDLLPPA